MAITYTPKYISEEALTAHVGAPALRRVLDDDNNGTADSNPLTLIIRNAEAFVEGYLRGIYTLPVTPVPTELERLCLDVAHAQLALRHPEAFRSFDGAQAYERARQQCCDLRNGKTRLNVTSTPEPGANQGGSLASAENDAEVPFDAPSKFWTDGGGHY